MINRNRRVAWILSAALLVLCTAGAALAAGASGVVSTSPPPEPFRKVSDLVALPEFIPGMGILYVDPATLPVGPFLGYDRDGRLVHVTFMVPLSDLEAHANLTDLANLADGFPVDHVDITYNPGHPGVAVPHYHVTLWNIPHGVEGETMQ